VKRLMPLLLVSVLGCLSSDERVPPAEVSFTLEPSQATHLGITTTSGWSVVFEEVVVVIGHVGFYDDDACASYYRTQYTWLMDTTAARKEKVGVAYAVGDCEPRFTLAYLDSDITRQGAGADDQLVALLGGNPLSAYVSGAAFRGEEVIDFEVLASGYPTFGPCLESYGSDRVVSWQLESGQSYEVPLVVSPEALFALISAPDEYEFDFAAADTDNDGTVSFYEHGTYLEERGGFELGGSPLTLNLLGSFVRIKGGGPCAIAEPDEVGFNPF